MRRYFSQQGEDQLLWGLVPNQTTGFFVDVGAFDGKHLSNSLSFELAGWTGICVEPHPHYYRLLQENRPGSTNIHAACVESDATATTPFFAEPLGLLSGIAPKPASWMQQRYSLRGMEFGNYERTVVPARSLGSVLRACKAPSRVDFLSLDTEGNELAILKGADLDHFVFRCVVVEANATNHARELTEYLNHHGYMLARQLGENLFFVRTVADAATLAHAEINCLIEDTIHPLGVQATPRWMRGRRIRIASPTRGRNPSPRLAHIVRLVGDSPAARERHLHVAQPITFETMRRAKERSNHSKDISLWAVRHIEETTPIPQAFSEAPPLKNYARDFVPDLARIAPSSRLARIVDVLSSLQQASDADYLIYTNVDIGLQPQFYDAVYSYIRSGCDALCINRLDLPKAVDGVPLLVEDLDRILALPGQRHPGIDCFVFHRSLLPLLNLGNVFLGAMPVGLVAMSQLRQHASRFRWIKNRRLTFHLGNDAVWQRPTNSPLVAANMEAARGLYTNYFRWPLYRRVLARCLEWCGRTGGERPSP